MLGLADLLCETLHEKADGNIEISKATLQSSPGGRCLVSDPLGRQWNQTVFTSQPLVSLSRVKEAVILYHLLEVSVKD